MKNHLLLAAVVGLFAVSSVVNAGVIVSTDFSGTTENAFVLEDVVYTTMGVTVPASEADLTVVNNPIVQGTGELHDTNDADGYFAVNNNVGNGGMWEMPINFTAGSNDIALTDFVLNWRHFNGNGGFQNAQRRVNVTFTIADITNGGNLSGPTTISTPSINTFNIGPQTMTFDLAGTTLVANTDYQLVVKASDNGGANHFGYDAITLNGDVISIPEPGSLSLLLVGLGVVAARRRRS